ncbi:hypothetical protein TNCV_3260941 [Trichonephila clavipes]|nr:hypothetical protein TNCV_3260941 [Trichonephila clavipes]
MHLRNIKCSNWPESPPTLSDEWLYYNKNLKLRPEVVWQAKQRRCIEFLTFWKIPGMPRILPTATNIRAMRSSTEGTGLSYTKLVMRRQKKQPLHDKSGDLASQ